jgi:hypothetical protein
LLADATEMTPTAPTSERRTAIRRLPRQPRPDRIELIT